MKEGTALERALRRLAQLLGVRIDSVAMGELLRRSDGESPIASREAWQTLCATLRELGFTRAVVVQSLEDLPLPLLTYSPLGGWGVISAQAAAGGWVHESFSEAGVELSRIENTADLVVIGISLESAQESGHEGGAFADLRGAFSGHWGAIVESALATVMVNVLALGTSFFSMQVYDRVIPTKGEETLLVLTVGVLLAITFDAIVKSARGEIMGGVVRGLDADLSRIVFQRLLSIRLDRLPRTVGTLSSQLRGYEVIRTFVSSATMYFLVDVPFGLVFVVVIWMLAGPLLAAVPTALWLLSIGIGLLLKNRMEHTAKGSAMAANRKMGLLVEAVEGAEAIKASGGGWRLLSRWAATTAEVIGHDDKIRTINERVMSAAQIGQQIGYVAVVAVGSVLAVRGEITMGALIACSIICGRALAPMAMMPNIMVQWSQAKASLQGLEKIWALETDHQEQQRVLAPEAIHGNYHVEGVQFAYPGTRLVLNIPRLLFRPGERVGVIGPVGAGKSTLLRLLAGLYRPQLGRVLLDGMDMEHISRAAVCENVGYLQQDTKLFSGTLRENLILGIPDPGDSAILEAAGKTGLSELISAHPKGLGLEIAEGGTGLSGGQRQLVGLTRLLLTNPSIWLMDEPTAAMDEMLEARCIGALKDAIAKDQLMVLVTHKPSMLNLVERLIVVNHHTVVVDGPTAEVLKYLQTPPEQRPGQPPLRGNVRAVGT